MKTSPISGERPTLERCLQWYRRVTRVPRGQTTRRVWLTARENRRSALPILRAGIRHSTQINHLMTAIAAADHPVSMLEITTRQYPYRNLATAMAVLQRRLAGYEMVWFERTTRIVHRGDGHGLEHYYRLTPLAQQIMQATEDH